MCDPLGAVLLIPPRVLFGHVSATSACWRSGVGDGGIEEGEGGIVLSSSRVARLLTPFDAASTSVVAAQRSAGEGNEMIRSTDGRHPQRLACWAHLLGRFHQLL